MSVPTLDGIRVETVASDRISTRVLFSGADADEAVIFVHGNASSATYWEETMLALPDGYRGIAYDQRGYGGADAEKKIDATRGVADLSDDLAALMNTLGIESAHLVGHSAGGSVLWQFMIDYAGMCKSVTLVAPGSPYGFGGTKDVNGTPNAPDFAGSGGGTVNPDFVRMMTEGERSDVQGGPRNTMNSFYWKAPFVPEREEDLLSSMLSTHMGGEDYPGDMTPSENWPMVAPGKFGMINALSPKYMPDLDKLYALENKPPVLWVRGSDDMIVSDTSFFDLGNLGKLGFVPGWPGDEVAPPQPMIAQTRAVLDKYAENGGSYSETVIADAGHSPYIEKPEEFNAALHSFITG